MFRLQFSGMKLDKDLQIIQADVLVEIEGETVVEEAMCVDVGLPALLISCFESTEPNRWAPIDEWRSIPFFVCGCGDPECRAIGFRTRLLPEENEIEWVMVEQAEERAYREQESYRIAIPEYKAQVLNAADSFLTLVEKENYRPLMKETAAVVQGLVERLRLDLDRNGE
ncbi:hypothetical protein [Paenibacillus koleovorans]|uniref:hypothetical protein n=1 Tax=Paenibacillus koleovorans TaxID=121608 RepID=UPI000FDC5231|nr:hypothetical protein [Paenibacillus koleovorans]